MARFRSRIGMRLGVGLGRPGRAPSREVELVPAPAAALRAGLGEPSAPPEAAEAELDTLRGELVRELDRIAADDPGSAAFRRIAG
jgi:hypothetical protein